MKTSTKPKKYASGVKLRLGLLDIEGDLYPVYRTNKPKVTLVTPNGDPVKQKYVDPDGQSFYFDQLDRRVEGDDGEFQVTNEQLVAAKQAVLDETKNILSLTVYGPSAEGHMFPADSKAYVFIPDQADAQNVKLYAVFRHIVANTNRWFCGEAKISRSSGFFRVLPWGEHIVVQKYAPPSEIQHYDVIDVSPGEAGEKMAAAMDKMEVELNPDDFDDVMARAIRQSADVEVAEKPAEADIEDAIDAFLDTL